MGFLHTQHVRRPQKFVDIFNTAAHDVILGTTKDVTDNNVIHQSLNQTIMRTLDNNQLTGTTVDTKSYAWNSKRRYR